MARGILGLEISSQHIRYIYLREGFRKSVLSRCQVFSFQQDPVTTKDPNILATAIKEIIHRENISPSKICLTLSGKEVFIHLIKIPKIPDIELREVIATEIEKVPSFSGREFDYIYSAFRLGENRIRVLFTAVAKEILDFYIQAINQTKIYFQSLEISPLNLAGILHSQTNGDKPEALLVLDEQSSQIMIFSQNECKLYYKIPTGRINLYPSQEQKLNNAVFSTWANEIKRVFRSYIREAPGEEIEKVWFIWDKKDTQELNKLLTEELDLSVNEPTLERFNIRLADRESEFNPIYFLPLIAPLTSLKKFKSLFFFEHLLHGLNVRRAIRKVGLIVALFILLFGFLSLMISMNFARARSRVLEDSKKVALQIAEVEKRTKELEKERISYLDMKEKLLKQASFVRMLNRVAPSEVFANIVLALPEDISLSLFKLSEGGQIEVNGSTLKIDSLAEFIRKINATGYFADVEFDFLKEKEIEEKKIVEFGIKTSLGKGLDAQQ